MVEGGRHQSVSCPFDPLSVAEAAIQTKAVIVDRAAPSAFYLHPDPSPYNSPMEKWLSRWYVRWYVYRQLKRLHRESAMPEKSSGDGSEPLASRNHAWGFYGTIGHHADPETAWELALSHITEATGCDPQEVRAFLDSRHGRHFADDVVNGLLTGSDLSTAVSAAIAQWMRWRITRHTSRKQGIPRGLPYLTGMVVQCGIEDDQP